MVTPESRHGPHRWADFADLAEDDRRELVGGRLVEAETPTALHERIVALLSFHLLAWSQPRGAGEVLASGYRVRVDDAHGFTPDLQFFRADNALDWRSSTLEAGRPDLVVEVISPSTARVDRMVKLQAYAHLGVPEYWIIDPERRELERLRLSKGGYTVPEVFSADDRFAPDTFPELIIPLDELWA